ncbi:uncharacterized protein YjdB [Dysgonomonas hofstadii]|uniref:Uncharacterized protein YjdB n=1 Tax=Dysgonomonas hofstadii TaxID=637886 RepID=A0A840CJL4_9BACT|nr:Ig-like domain-containing protein [Dysgonomonas hofstadii]MBB4034198.1 uncharacterized protein YjdB [Dysgonomonas hofstadii]
MKHILKKYSSGCLVLAATFIAMVSCSDDDASSNLSSAIYPKSVEISVPAELQPLIYTDQILGIKVLPMIKGESVTFGYTILPEEVTFKDVKWTSSDVSVATVDENNKVTAVSGDGAGYSIIQVAPDAFYSGSNIYGTLKIVVANSLVPAQSITLSSPADDVFAGETLQLTATILPEEATYRTVKWTSSNESVATVDMNGLVTGKVNSETFASATITATSLDGAQVIATKIITVKQIVEPQSITIDQTYSVNNNYFCAINEKTLNLNFTTVPTDATLSLIEWTSSDESIATVQNGVVTYNQEGVFGDVTITATCPSTGNTSSIKLNLAEGLLRELFHDQSNYTWYNAQQSGNGTSSSHVWSYGMVKVTTYTQNDTNQRGDFRCWSPKTWLHAGKYPIVAIRMEDALDKYAADGVTARNITLDASGNCNGAAYSGGLNGNNNKWLHDYKCSDGSHVFIYDMSSQAWATGGILPTNALATFTTLQFKYADIKTLTKQVTYNVYWMQSFKTIDDLKAYITSEGLTYDIIK